MDPQKLPNPETENEMTLPPVAGAEQSLPNSPEVRQQGSEKNPEFVTEPGQGSQSSPAPAVAAQAPATLQGVPAAPVPPAVAPTSQPAVNPQIADDIDLIEKEWVEKAKEVVNHTKDDPHRQNKEINKVKADYIKKRYNKELKVSED